MFVTLPKLLGLMAFELDFGAGERPDKRGRILAPPLFVWKARKLLVDTMFP